MYPTKQWCDGAARLSRAVAVAALAMGLTACGGLFKRVSPEDPVSDVELDSGTNLYDQAKKTFAADFQDSANAGYDLQMRRVDLAQAATARTKLATARRDYDTARAKWIDSAQTNRETAQLDLDKARAAWQTAKIDLDAADARVEQDPTLKALYSGFVMVDLECARYINALGLGSQAGQYGRQQTTLLGAATTAIMGVAGSAAAEIATASSGFSLATSSVDAYTTSYLFSDATKSISRIVHEAQDLRRQSIESQLEYMNHANMVQAVARYQEVCRPAQIRALIDSALSNTKVTTESTGKTGNAAQDDELARILAPLRAEVNKDLTETDAIYLYAWYTSAEPVREKLERGSTVLKGLTQSAASRATLPLKLARVFLPITLPESTVAQRWEPGLKQIVKVAEAPTKPALVTPPPDPQRDLVSADTLQNALSGKMLYRARRSFQTENLIMK